jgi:isopenicillin N synthase-like dioxygenase
MLRLVDCNIGPPFEVGYGPNKWPSTPKDFQETSEAYIESVTSLGTNVMKAIALGLDIDEALFTSRIDKCCWNLRIIGYATNTTHRSSKESRIGEHTGMRSTRSICPSHLSSYWTVFGILTFLLSDSQTDALQVLAKTGEWVTANPIPVSLPLKCCTLHPPYYRNFWLLTGTGSTGLLSV